MREFLTILWFFTIFSLVLSTGCGGSKQEEPAPQAPLAGAQQEAAGARAYVVQEAEGSAIEGRVLLQGKAPPPKRVQVTQDSEVCGKQREVYSVRVQNGGVDEAVVWIDDIQRGKPFSFPPLTIRQKDCTFVPHVSVAAPGEIKVASEDPIPHNVHTYAQASREYNESMNQLRSEISLSLPRPDLISVRCDLHGWMQAYVVVAKNPYYAVTSQGGNFRIDSVPPGRYHLKVWSESLGEDDKEILVEAGKPTHIDFTLQGQAAQTAGGK
jgi:Carboxypeptidase regulatory-like domain